MQSRAKTVRGKLLYVGVTFPEVTLLKIAVVTRGRVTRTN
jgi:hypothetical protein